jgi:RNA polymerase sigma factor FliA
MTGLVVDGARTMRVTKHETEADIAVRDQLVMEHVGLVKAMASRLANRLPPQVEVSELVSVGVLGLIDAAGRFRPSLGVPFSAFARRRIHGAMLDALRGLDWAPRAVRKLRRDVDAAIATLRFELGREPEAVDIAQALDVSEAEYEKMLDRLKSAELASIRQSTPNEDGRSALDVEIEPSEGPHQRLEREEMRRLLASAITELPDRERHILALYYEEELTLAEIGQVIGVGESRVSQLRTQAIARLRSILSTRLARKDAA